jgi:hypothetical protein
MGLNRGKQTNFKKDRKISKSTISADALMRIFKEDVVNLRPTFIITEVK